jgi:hypothetical protein
MPLAYWAKHGSASWPPEAVVQTLSYDSVVVPTRTALPADFLEALAQRVTANNMGTPWVRRVPGSERERKSLCCFLAAAHLAYRRMVLPRSLPPPQPEDEPLRVNVLFKHIEVRPAR